MRNGFLRENSWVNVNQIVWIPQGKCSYLAWKFIIKNLKFPDYFKFLCIFYYEAWEEFFLNRFNFNGRKSEWFPIADFLKWDLINGDIYSFDSDHLIRYSNYRGFRPPPSFVMQKPKKFLFLILVCNP
jgi:hypothetical protein